MTLVMNKKPKICAIAEGLSCGCIFGGVETIWSLGRVATDIYFSYFVAAVIFKGRIDSINLIAVVIFEGGIDSIPLSVTSLIVLMLILVIDSIVVVVIAVIVYILNDS
jgi:hypothetical protein